MKVLVVEVSETVKILTNAQMAHTTAMTMLIAKILLVPGNAPVRSAIMEPVSTVTMLTSVLTRVHPERVNNL